MAGSYESSGLHSLASLREEERRLAQQRAAAAQERAESEQRARQEAERREAKRVSAERQSRHEAEAAQRAQIVQLENAQRAEFERAERLLRSSAELKSQLDRERVTRRNAELGLTSQLLRQRLWTSGASAAILAGGLSVAGVYFGALRPSSERALASAERALLGERRARADAQQGEAHLRLLADQLSLRISSLERTLHEERQQRSAAPVQGAARVPAKHSSVVLPNQPCRDDGDPLNPCLKR